MARQDKGSHRWTTAEKQTVCKRLRSKGWDGRLKNLDRTNVVALAAKFGIEEGRAEAQLGRQLKAAICRNRPDRWAKEWRDAWAAAVKES